DDPDCGCHHHHHHGHDADEVFTSWGRETTKKFTQDEINSILVALDDKAQYGMVLRAKGVVEGEDGSWIHFDHVPGEADVRTGCANVTGRVCVIGSKINEAAIAALFGV
ncbi:MAG: cobalamin biosynthesis protein CobW, partial [Oscillospiraceae bacterium]|nr:cobalamin biosynthesis protein CobW [Oscillospiraceae bacterium]